LTSCQEGVVQGFQPLNSGQRVPILAAVGPLQFEVVQFRLESEYGAESRLESTAWKFARWVGPGVTREQLTQKSLPTGAVAALDSSGHVVILFPGDWALAYFVEKNPEVPLSNTYE
jgi:peptide chain release factor 3